MVMKFSSSLNLYGHPELRDALEKDEAHMFHLIRHVLNSDTSEQIAIRLREDKAMVFLNLLCTAVSLFKFLKHLMVYSSVMQCQMKDKSFSEDPNVLCKARRLRQKLSNACHLMPDSLCLDGVQISDSEPSYCGGFADIFKGSHRERDVAVKRLRVTQRTQGHYSTRRVCIPDTTTL